MDIFQSAGLSAKRTATFEERRDVSIGGRLRLNSVERGVKPYAGCKGDLTFNACKVVTVRGSRHYVMRNT